MDDARLEQTVKPILQALLLADHVYQDRKTGKFIIAGTFTNLVCVQHTPSEQGKEGIVEVPIDKVHHAGSPHVYINLTEVRTECPLQLRYVQLNTSLAVFETSFVVRGCNDPLRSIEITLPLPLLPRVLGSYALELLYDNELLGSHRVTVRNGTPPDETEEK